MITLTLLHPIKSIPVQKWQFQTNSVIRVGRANDNDVVLYSAVVSRYHVQIKPLENNWCLANLGSNGTFINGQKIKKIILKNGMVIRLASSGPKILINLQEVEPSSQSLEISQPQTKLRNVEISPETVLDG